MRVEFSPEFLAAYNRSSLKSQTNPPCCKGQDLERLLSLPAIQTESTEARALKAAKKRDAKLGEERTQEQRRSS